MDGREGMAYPSGPASFYLNRGGGPGNSGSGPNFHGGSSAAQPSGLHTHPTPTSVFKNLSNPNISAQPNLGATSGGNSVSGGPSFQAEHPSANLSHARNTAVVTSGESPGGEPVKKKRGRPRKYGPDGANMSLGLSPLSPSKNSSGAMSSGEKKPKGRPRGTGWKQKLAPLGEWMNSSAGLAFTPHVLRVGVGEDVAAKILAFSQQRSRALCVMSANGSVSAITLRQPTASGSTVTYEGRFEILCLSGSYLVAESGGPRNRTGGISISVCSPDGHIIGGAIGGRLIAASLVQVVACSFVYGNTKQPTKPYVDSGMGDETIPLDQPVEQSPTPNTAPSGRIYTPSSGSSVWPPVPGPEVKNPQTDIDLMRG